MNQHTVQLYLIYSKFQFLIPYAILSYKPEQPKDKLVQLETPMRHYIMYMFLHSYTSICMNFIADKQILKLADFVIYLEQIE